MKTVKKIGSLLFALTLVTALTVPALADVIWEPENSFFKAHQAECDYIYDHQYEAQTNAKVCADPEKQTAVGTVPVGDTRGVQWIWTDAAGEAWGFSNRDEGWLRLSDFRRLYTESVFFAERAGELADESGALPFSAERAFWSYTFPGSGTTTGVRFGGRDSIGVDDPNFRYDKTYTDEAGRRWGMASYSGRYHFWVCLSDPYDDALPRTAPKYADEPAPTPTDPVLPTPVEPTPTEEPSGADAPDVPAAPAAEQGAPVGLIAGLVAAAVAASGALLVILRRKK